MARCSIYEKASTLYEHNNSAPLTSLAKKEKTTLSESVRPTSASSEVSQFFQTTELWTRLKTSTIKDKGWVVEIKYPCNSNWSEQLAQALIYNNGTASISEIYDYLLTLDTKEFKKRSESEATKMVYDRVLKQKFFQVIQQFPRKNSVVNFNCDSKYVEIKNRPSKSIT
ncbi:hypothetical protein D5R81_08735 [Parashewanella spongiae]|uniref:Uncharacterized protein n=1 Tax=Parashewanella spongiae TaxID=342950 RepID=A0A3A6TRW6_9GAMM|nr:hypothetical protein [Parashewanella spongiae]MCL1077958.1 hypothetical protein [Parashewanella spongiae]RJY16917.1 hypothetical protein D5R81_08735 [Parashewanella spongiae]